MNRARYIARACLAFTVGGAVVLALASTDLTQSPTLIAQAGIIAAALTFGAAVRTRPDRPERPARGVRLIWLGLAASLLALGGVLVGAGHAAAGIAADTLAAGALWLAFRRPAPD